MALPVLAVLVGAAFMVAAGLLYRQERARAIDELLGLTPISLDEERVDPASPLTDRAVDLAGQVVEHFDRERSLSHALERAKIPLRPGEFLIVVLGGSLGVAAALLFVTSSLPLAVVGALVAASAGPVVVRRRIAKRRQAFQDQLPDALTLVASSLSAGHTFLRAIQMMCEESGPPLSEEFSRVVAESRLGDPVVAALERMAARLQIRDMDMVVQAIRIQQTVGGRLADLLHTLGEFMRAREEVRREVKVLTAEGRMSAYVLAGLVPFLFGVMNMLNPEYVQPLYSGWGLGLLVACTVSVALGMVVILRMVRIDI
ncbi:MAG: type II secretion system F family protein [Acidimicrobiia bacterium]